MSSELQARAKAEARAARRDGPCAGGRRCAETSAVTAESTHRAIDAVWRIESARLIAALARIVRDVGLAEELAQDALVAALEQWPEAGVPENPGAWLMATAKHRAIDRLRRSKRLERKHEEIGHALEADRARGGAGSRRARSTTTSATISLRLVFIACHPVLSTEARVALTLRLLGGLTTEEIARAFLVPEPTIAQRIVRAKRTLADGATCRSRCRAAPSSPRGSRRCSRSSTSSSTRATRRPRATTGCARRSARTRCASAACSPSSRRASRRCTGSSR